MNPQELPKDFDGTFKFTNARDTEFKARWNSVEYTFPAMKTIPMVIANATPLEVQSIRKKFAREWAIEEWYKSPKFIGMNNVPLGGMPALYTDSDLIPFIQKCLEPLPLAHATAKLIVNNDDSKFTVDQKGRKRTRVLDPNESLMAQASGPVEE